MKGPDNSSRVASKLRPEEVPLAIEEKRLRTERRVIERRHTMPYNLRTLLIVDGLTWVDPEGSERRRRIRRRADRETLAAKVLKRARP